MSTARKVLNTNLQLKTNKPTNKPVLLKEMIPKLEQAQYSLILINL